MPDFVITSTTPPANRPYSELKLFVTTRNSWTASGFGARLPVPLKPRDVAAAVEEVIYGSRAAVRRTIHYRDLLRHAERIAACGRVHTGSQIQ